MNLILIQYFDALFHPFHKHEDKELGFVDFMSVSWIFSIINGIYSLISIHLGLLAFHYVYEDRDFVSDFFYNRFYLEGKTLIFWGILVQVALFPLLALVYNRVWASFLKFFAMLYELEEGLEERATKIVNYSMVSYVFLLIPVFGNFLQSFSYLFYLYAGIRTHFKLGPLQSFIVLLAPLVVFSILFFILILLVTLLIASILSSF